MTTYVNEYINQPELFTPSSQLFKDLYQSTISLAAMLHAASYKMYKDTINPINFTYEDNLKVRNYMLHTFPSELALLETNLLILLSVCAPEVIASPEVFMLDVQSCRAMHIANISDMLILRQGVIYLNVLVDSKTYRICLGFNNNPTNISKFRAFLNVRCGYKM